MHGGGDHHNPGDAPQALPAARVGTRTAAEPQPLSTEPGPLPRPPRERAPGPGTPRRPVLRAIPLPPADPDEESAAQFHTQLEEGDADDRPEPRAVPDVEPAAATALAAAAAPVRAGQGGWTLPFLCAGIALIACCLLIPQADQNRQLYYQVETLKADLEQIQKQGKTNEAFLKRVQEDPTLAERLIHRQMRYVRDGAQELPLRGTDPFGDMSPFSLVAVPPPTPMPDYQPVGGKLALLCRQPRSQLYLMGLGLLLVACGLVLGYTAQRGE